MFRMDDGVVPRDLKIDVMRQGLRELRGEYKRCVEGGRGPQICYVLLANRLIDMFGSLLPYVIHDDEYRFYILKGADGKLLVYDADVDRYKIVELSQAAATLLS
jgi:hypothetical protein